MALCVPEPVASDSSSMEHIAARLRAIMFDEKHCGERLGRVGDLPDFAGSKLPKPYLLPASDPLDIAIALFLLNEAIPLHKAYELFTPADIDGLREMSVVQADGCNIFSLLNLLPCSGNYFLTDRSSVPAGESPQANRVMWLYHESYILAGLVDRKTHVRTVLDLGTGSGIHALLACQHSDEAIGVDMNPRAIAFSRFNQRLNGRKNLHYLLGDLYAPVAGRQFDLIVANPPYNPTPFVPAGADYWSGGWSGEEILSRIIRGLDAHLSEYGICHIITLLCHHKLGPSYRQKLDSWLTGGIHSFDIMAQVMDGQYYFANAHSEDHRLFLQKHFSSFEFGVISLRKKRNKASFYYHGPPRILQPWFDENGCFVAPINHEFFDACTAWCSDSARSQTLTSVS